MTLLLALALAVLPCPNNGHNQHRSAAAKSAFRHQHPCPAGPDAGSVTRCRGWIIDHVCPLECYCKSKHAVDLPVNMQWQTDAQAKAKDRWELDCKRSCR